MQKITVLRHSTPETFPTDHRLRNLSADGIQLAKDRRNQLGNINYDLVLSSPLTRAIQTAVIVSGSSDESTVIKVSELFYIETDPIHGVVERMFQKYGHSTLENYYNDEGADILKKHGQTAYEAVIRIFSAKSNCKQILMVGHGCLINAMVDMSSPLAKYIRNIYIHVCSGYVLSLENDAIVAVELVF